MCALSSVWQHCINSRGGAKSSEMNVDGVKLIKLNRANLECSGGEIQRVECGWFKVDKIE